MPALFVNRSLLIHWVQQFEFTMWHGVHEFEFTMLHITLKMMLTYEVELKWGLKLIIWRRFHKQLSRQ